MSSGLTYDTESQAEIMAADYHVQGYTTRISKTPEGKYKVFVSRGIHTPSLEFTDPEVAAGIERHRISQRVTEATALSEQEEIEEALKKARKESVTKRILAREPETMQKAHLIEKKENLKEIQGNRVRRGMDGGNIIPVFDPETNQIIDYRLDIKGIEQKASEALEKGVRTRIERTADDIKNLPLTTKDFTGGIIESASKQINVKGGMKAQYRATVGEGEQPQMRIARLPSKPEISKGIIGADRPAISKIGSPGMEEANNLGIKTRGFEAQPTTGGFGSPPSEPPLKKTPQAGKITANGGGNSDKTDKIGEGFAGMFIKKKTEEKQEE